MRGPTINLDIWSYKDSWAIPGSDRTRGIKCDRKLAYLRASWTARVGKMRLILLPSSKSREQKKEAPSCPSANVLSAIVIAIVVLPVPASPFSQYTGGLAKSLVQSSILSRTAPRVPFRQPPRPLCRNSAPWAQRKPLRTAASSAEYPFQVRRIEGTGWSDLGSAKRLFRLLGRKRGLLTIRECS